jgi:hypothetical protein
MRFSAPSGFVFLISLIIAVAAVLTETNTIPSFVPLSTVWMMAVGYAVLAAGCLIKGA